MANEELLAHIERVRTELVAAKNISPEDRDLVGILMTDIVAHLTEEESDEQARGNLSDRLRKQVTNLEVDHPKLAGAFERMINMLASLGI
ncbi:MAG: hypothetical protein DRR06_01245 [Gammaproteobacteria bacterium]|nr:MAG: hypothetical protein DRR06_01245 [Gammaproteobacteria bacterium]